MHQNTPFTISGALIVLIPFLGFPNSWETFFIVILGLYIAGLSLYKSVRARYTATPIQPVEQTFLDYDDSKTIGENKTNS